MDGQVLPAMQYKQTKIQKQTNKQNKNSTENKIKKTKLQNKQKIQMDGRVLPASGPRPRIQGELLQPCLCHK